MSARATIKLATDWIDEHIAPLDPEDIPVAAAGGRVLAQDVMAAIDLPARDRAAWDGLALHADDTAGASAYNPIGFRRVLPGTPLAPNDAVLLNTADPLPAGADAVAPLAHIEQSATGGYEIVEGVAPGTGVERKASQFRRGATLLRRGQLLLPYRIGLLAAAGVKHLRVMRRPALHCVLVAQTQSGPPPGDDVTSANGPLLSALIERDGGTLAELRQVGGSGDALRNAVAAAEADGIIVVGGTGARPDEVSASAIGDIGELAIHGVALQPGEAAGIGRRRDGVPIVLLPAAPVACLWAYEFLAGRAIRRLAGRDPEFPFPVREMTILRKVVSAIGMTEIFLVRSLGDDRVEPVASFAEAGLGALVGADGFVIVAEGSEGFPAGERAAVHFFEAGAHPPLDPQADPT